MEATALSIGKSVLSGALGYAKSAWAEEVALQLGVTRDQAFIRDELEMMLSFLMAAHEERDKRMVVETWVKQVRVVSYDVEDSLMDFAVRVDKQSWWQPWRIPRTLRDRRRVAKQMKDLRAKIEDVSQRSMRYRLIEGGSRSMVAATAGDTAASAAAMFGISEARYAAKKGQSSLDLTQLINQETEDLAVIAVWGTSGKVGLMSSIWEAYENSDTQKNFPCRAWVKVMHPFIPKEFFLSLLEEFRPAAGVNSLMETEKTKQVPEPLEEFNGYVNDKRCLIVLDDLSTIREWNRIKQCFPINKKRNIIIVPTTDVEVAKLCVGQNSVVSELKQLSADQTIYAFYEESSQDIAHSTESVSSSTTATSEIQDDQHKYAGREGEKELIAKLILEHSDNQLKVIAVWGMGGIGKTTLVTDVYQRQDINEKFTKHASVTVLRPFKIQEFLRKIAMDLDAESSGKKGARDFVGYKKKHYASMSVKDLTDELDRLSENRNCLIVVDDLLYTPEWDTILKEFCKLKKARSWTIVITTRQKDIAEYCCKNQGCKDQRYIRKLDILGAEEARELFIKTVFKRTIDLNKDYPELVEPEKLILKRCDGLPLAIVTIGSFLAEQETKSAVEWTKLNAHINAELEMNPRIGLIRAVLMKSYDGLPYYLKPCFLYMSIFPEDNTISRRRLVHRWAVEGYSAEARDKSSVEIADGYFEKLMERSMVLPTQERIFSRQKADSCRLHDLIRDISISMATKENLVFRLEEGCSSNTHGTVRHLAISSNWDGDENEFQSIAELSRIRSLTVFGKWKPFYISDQMRFLRVLDLEDTKGLANHCLENIGKLLHLRYLSLRGCSDIFCLPDSMGNLSQLEVLDIKNTQVLVLPKTIVKLRKLRHLHAGADFCMDRSRLSYCGRCVELLKVQREACLGRWSRRDWCTLACCAALPAIAMGRQFEDDSGVTLPRGMRKVKSLHTMRYVHLAWGNAVVEEIKGLTSLRKLGVAGISEKNSHNLCLAISKLSRLESLSLYTELDLSECLDGMLAPPVNLQSLKLRHCRMVKFPKWIKGLHNLVKLTLRDTGLLQNGAHMLMNYIGKLRNLSFLRLTEWSNISIDKIQFSSGLFMSLRVLDFYFGSDPEIESVMFDDNAMPKLEVLRLGLEKQVEFSGLQCLQSIKEVHVYNYSSAESSKEEFSGMLRKELDENNKGHVLLKVD